MTVHGNLLGLGSSEKRALERLGQRRVPASRILSAELAAQMCLLSRELGRQIGLFIDRGGQVTQVAVGDASRIELPDFGRLRASERRFRALRFVHTHLRSEPLSRDDLTDLVRLRLDMLVAVGVSPDGLPGGIFYAHLLPPSPGGELYLQEGPFNIGMLREDFLALIGSLEEEFARSDEARPVRGKDGRALLVHVARSQKDVPEAERSLAELSELARTAGVEVAEKVLQVRPKKDPLYLVGKGKLEDINVRAMQEDAQVIIFDHEIGANQARAIAAVTDAKVIDRTQLILDIFAQHAHSVEGKLQVELAQLKYLLPRLGAKDDSLSRLTGGIGGRRGPGETKIEIGKRRARERITRLEKRLEDSARSREQRRMKRRRAGVPIVSIVGYTNAGKSTLLNALTDSTVQVENKLFVTLDTASRRLRFPREREIVVTDTVGFIRDLPKDLVSAFKATLEELADASLLLHIIDAGDPSRFDQISWVERILADLELMHIPRLLVLNKADLAEPDQLREDCDRLSAVSVSALSKQTFAPLLHRMEESIWRPQ
ncbi:MAG: GTPase HflX [Myxococcota bacterium]|nr:GTPase HflX [Myxococcota bacterium]